MERKRVSGAPDRRQLLLQMLPTGAFACLLCRNGLAAAGQTKGTAPPAKNKYQAPCEMSYEELFQFAYGYDFIPAMKAMGAEMGREKLVETLSRAYSAAAVERVREQLKANPKNDLATWTADVRNQIPIYKNALTMKLVEDTPTAVEARITECLWAKTFCEANAADIGYACLCHAEFAALAAFNPKIKLTFTKTLMQGHDCCNPRYVMEA
jgi:L-2-amino-thiazoline-4-carboxylic acid hydrolase